MAIIQKQQKILSLKEGLGMGLIVLLCSLTSSAQVQLKRQADWGSILVSAHPDRPGMVVRRLKPGSPLEKAGIRENDLVVKIGNTSLSDPDLSGKVIRSYRGGEEVTLTVLKDGVLYDHNVTLLPKPLEKYTGIEVTYGSVVTERGHHMRTVFTRSKGKSGNIPALMIVQWLSCDPIEINTEKVSRYDSLIFQLVAESGLAVMRVEKPGMGDSEGPDCSDCDYQTELAAYRAAMRKLKQTEGIDTSSIYVMGISIGASGAPLLFANENIKGFIVSGGFTKTWLEHMLEIERNRLALSGSKPGEITASINKFSLFYNEYLIRKKTPAEVIKENPHLKDIWYDGDSHQYGRPAAYYQQVQEMNVADVWSKVNGKVLVIYGEYDWIMSRTDHQEIVRIVNGNRPGNATFKEIGKMGHNFTLHPSMEDSFSGANAVYAKEVFSIIMDWIKRFR